MDAPEYISPSPGSRTVCQLECSSRVMSCQRPRIPYLPSSTSYKHGPVLLTRGDMAISAPDMRE